MYLCIEVPLLTPHVGGPRAARRIHKADIGPPGWNTRGATPKPITPIACLASSDRGYRL